MQKRFVARGACRGMRRGIAVLAAVVAATVSCGEPRATTGVGRPRSDRSSLPNLLQCPTNQTQSSQALVGVLGGTVQVGGTSITIPAGALSVPTLITVTVPASQYVEIDVRANDLLSFLFNAPVSVTIDYSRCTRANIANDTLSVWHIDPSTNTLLEDMGGVDDKTHETITFSTGHLSGYAVAF
jgi:hypothetical protein